MREIKFRAWFPLKEQMIEHENLSLQYDKEEGFTFAFNCADFDEEGNVSGTLNFELMQYTGLDDKHGNPIYEGDILMVTDHPFEGSIKVDGNYQVGYNEYMECVAGSWLLFRMRHFGEVVGNIWENSELLKGE